MTPRLRANSSRNSNTVWTNEGRQAVPYLVDQFRMAVFGGMIVGLASIGLIETALVRLGEPSLTGRDVISYVSSAAIVFGLGHAIWRRRLAWARWVFIVLAALGVPFQLIFAVGIIQLVPFAALFQIAAVAINVYAIYLLFTPEARAWVSPTPVPAPTDSPS